MTDQLRQAAQQALEALEGLFGLPNQWESGGVAVWRLGGSDAPRQAITALRTALEQQQAEPPPEWLLVKNILDVFGLDAIAFVTAWKAVQQRAEPVAYFDFQEHKFSWAKHMKISPVPVSVKVEPMKLYSESTKRQWVGLTGEDFLEACQLAERGNYLLAFQRIQIKLKERNT